MSQKDKNGNNMSTSKTALESRAICIESLINNPESKMRIGIKMVEEIVSQETKDRKIHAPLTPEEKVLLSL